MLLLRCLYQCCHDNLHNELVLQFSWKKIHIKFLSFFLSKRYFLYSLSINALNCFIILIIWFSSNFIYQLSWQLEPLLTLSYFLWPWPVFCDLDLIAVRKRRCGIPEDEPPKGLPTWLGKELWEFLCVGWFSENVLREHNVKYKTHWSGWFSTSCFC